MEKQNNFRKVSEATSESWSKGQRASVLEYARRTSISYKFRCWVASSKLNHGRAHGVLPLNKQGQPRTSAKFQRTALARENHKLIQEYREHKKLKGDCEVGAPKLRAGRGRGS